jgi:hypothetical protein
MTYRQATFYQIGGAIDQTLNRRLRRGADIVGIQTVGECDARCNRRPVGDTSPKAAGARTSTPGAINDEGHV